LSAREEKAILDSSAFALVFLLLKPTDHDALVAFWILSSPLENNFPSLISRAVINDHNFNLTRQLVCLLLPKHKVDVSTKHVWEALLFVVSRHHEA
jgi:hypothetical protein